MENLRTYEPDNQNIVASPYFMKNFEFSDEYGEASEELRVCRYLSQMLRIFGNDVIYAHKGIDSVSLNNGVFSITIGYGKVIQDSTLITFPTITLELDVSTFDYSNDKAIVFTNFEYNTMDRNTNTDPNPLTFRLGVYEGSTGNIWQNNNTQYSWDHNTNRIMVAAYTLDTLEPINEMNIKGVNYYELGRGQLSPTISYDGGMI